MFWMFSHTHRQTDTLVNPPNHYCQILRAAYFKKPLIWFMIVWIKYLFASITVKEIKAASKLTSKQQSIFGNLSFLLSTCIFYKSGILKCSTFVLLTSHSLVAYALVCYEQKNLNLYPFFSYLPHLFYITMLKFAFKSLPSLRKHCFITWRIINSH